MQKDPCQLKNIAGGIRADALAGYAAVAAELATCKGITCRIVECDPRLPD